MINNKTIKVNNKTYTINKLLGKGKSGYSYLAYYNEIPYVIKKIHHEPCDYYSFGNKLEAELNAYDVLSKLLPGIPKLIDVDKDSEIVVKEYIDGLTVFDLVKEGRLDEIYFEKIKEITNILYANNINIDYFPTNFIMKKNILYYIDYEFNSYMEEWNFENWGIKYWSKTKEFMDYVKNH
jgi:serine/threonine protein kinase